MVIHIFLLILTAGFRAIDAFVVGPKVHVQSTTSLSLVPSTKKQQCYDDTKDDTIRPRRAFFHSVAVATVGTMTVIACDLLGLPANAEATPEGAATTTVAMKTFTDPEGMFVINIPQRFYAIRRTNQGDLPNAATGSGRRGSSIFTSGDLAKVEVLAIER